MPCVYRYTQTYTVARILPSTFVLCKFNTRPSGSRRIRRKADRRVHQAIGLVLFNTCVLVYVCICITCSSVCVCARACMLRVEHFMKKSFSIYFNWYFFIYIRAWPNRSDREGRGDFSKSGVHGPVRTHPDTRVSPRLYVVNRRYNINYIKLITFFGDRTKRPVAENPPVDRDH